MPSKNQKIVQIAPAIPGIFGQYIDDEGTYNSPIICFALIEETRKGKVFRSVIAMDMSPDGIIEECIPNSFIFPTAPKTP